MSAIEHYREPAVSERSLAMIERQADVIAKSGAAGAYKGKPADIVLAGIQALALDVPLVTALTDFFPIESQGVVRLTLSARLRVALCMRAGHQFWFDHTDTKSATACLQRRGERRIHKLTYTIEQAKAAGLAGKTNWTKHPAEMLRAAAARQLVVAGAPDILLGMPAELVLAEVDEGVEPEPDRLEILDHSETSPPVAQPDTISDTERSKLLAFLAELTPAEVEQVKAAVKGRVANIKSHQFTAEHGRLLAEAMREVVKARPPEGFDEAIADAAAGAEVAYGPGEEPFEA